MFPGALMGAHARGPGASTTHTVALRRACTPRAARAA
jgi:hypothetical protein